MNFSIEKKGYSVSEVDSFVEDLMAKYQRLQAQNTELEQKLATAKRLIRRFSDTENALKQNIADSKRAAAYMISDAQDRSEELLDSARESCGEIISDLDMQIGEKLVTVDRLKAEVAAFKDELFGLYSSHIELIDKLALTAETFEYVPDYTPVAEAVDKFEEGETPCVEMPEFVEYPEESIFTELEEEEESSEDFVLEEPAEEPANEEEIVFSAELEDVAADEVEDEDEDEELQQIALNEEEYAAAVEFDFDSFHIDGVDDVAEADKVSADEEFSVEPEIELELEIEDEDDDFETEEEPSRSPEEEKKETDYFKYLSDFANSEDGENF